MADDPVISATGLRKRFGRNVALDGLDLVAPRGSITALIGPSGGGKSTLLKMLVGLVRPDAGVARVFGLDPSREPDGTAVRRRAAFVSQGKAVYPDLTVGGLIRSTAAFFPNWRGELADRYLARFDLAADASLRSLSIGARAKLVLLLAFCRAPDLLVLDEPTSDLDAAAAEQALQAIVGYVAEEQATVVLASRHLAEAERIADRLTIVHRGQALLSGALDDLQHRFRRVSLMLPEDAAVDDLRGPHLLRVRADGRRVELAVNGDEAEVVAQAGRLGARTIEVAPMSLQEIFLETIRAED